MYTAFSRGQKIYFLCCLLPAALWHFFWWMPCGRNRSAENGSVGYCCVFWLRSLWQGFMRRSNRQGCFRRQAGYKGKKKWLWEGIPNGFFYVERDCRGFCKGWLFCDVYVIWEKEGGFLTNFLILRMGNDFAAGFALREGGFYCMLKVGKRDCGGLQRREWMEWRW